MLSDKNFLLTGYRVVQKSALTVKRLSLRHSLNVGWSTLMERVKLHSHTKEGN